MLRLRTEYKFNDKLTGEIGADFNAQQKFMLPFLCLDYRVRQSAAVIPWLQCQAAHLLQMMHCTALLTLLMWAGHCHIVGGTLRIPYLAPWDIRKFNSEQSALISAGSMHWAAGNMQCAVCYHCSLHGHLPFSSACHEQDSRPLQPRSGTARPFCRHRTALALACLHAGKPDGAYGQSETQTLHDPPSDSRHPIICAPCCSSKPLWIPACSCMPKAETWELCGCTTVASLTASPSPSPSRVSAPRSSQMWEPTLQVSTINLPEGE